MSQVELSAVLPALDGIEDALEIYPPGFYASLSPAIFISGPFAPPRERSGGTYGPNWIILVATRSSGEDGIYQTARFGVHHEFSSLVWARFPLLRAAWGSFMPAGWEPAREDGEALRASYERIPDPSDGFLTLYAATAAENDFNTYAETMFTNPDHVLKLAKRHPVIASKAAMLMDAYAKLDARMNDVFERLRLVEIRALPRVQAEISVGPISLPQPEIVHGANEPTTE